MSVLTKKLTKLFSALNEQDRQTLIAFATFLHANKTMTTEEIAKPKIIPPINDESVIAALKRLSAMYFMLDKANMLNEASELVSQHVMQGRDKADVIKSCEKLFEDHYQWMLNSKENTV